MFECTVLEWITIVCTGLLGITGICLVVYGLWTMVADAIGESKMSTDVVLGLVVPATAALVVLTAVLVGVAFR